MNLAERLRKGAALLGEFWRNGERCRNGWSEDCQCDEKTKFCIAKAQWVALAKKSRPVDMAGLDPDGDMFVIEAMRASELHASGLTITLDTGITIGPKGVASVIDAAYVVEAPEAAPAVLKVLSSFQGAMVVKNEVSEKPWTST